MSATANTMIHVMARHLAAQIMPYSSHSISSRKATIEFGGFAVITLTVRGRDRISVAYKYTDSKPSAAVIKRVEDAVRNAIDTATYQVFGFETTILP